MPKGIGRGHRLQILQYRRSSVMSEPRHNPIPEDPFELFEHPPFEPAARRQATVFGAPAELCWLPKRKARRGVPKTGKPALPAPFVARILAEEAVWRGGNMALTPNRYPFSSRQAMLWSEQPIREPDLGLLEMGLQLQQQVGGTLLINSVGAAASIARCHLHLLAEKLPFLAALDATPAQPAAVGDLVGDPVGDVDYLLLSAPFPGVGLGVRGPVPARAVAVHRLLEVRSTPAFNLVSQDQTTWLFPRSAIETPAPHFPHALGAAELWGRWCFADQGPFERASAEDLEEAVRISCYPSTDS